jgi:enediyne biosynthesis protein E4
MQSQSDCGEVSTTRTFFNPLVAIGITLMLFSAVGAQSPLDSAIQFRDATQSSGLNFIHFDGHSGKQYLIELMACGLATFDGDNDGWIDAYFTNGTSLPYGPQTDTRSDGFYRNIHGTNFTDATIPAGLHESQYGLGVTAADFDNDGFQDLYISNFAGNRLMHNNGDGTFRNVTAFAGVANGDKFGAGVAFLDADDDGKLDIYAANYVDFDFERHAQLAPASFPFPPGPRDFPPTRDCLFINNGDGTFTDRSHESGIASVAGPSMGVICGDFDRDDDTDVFVCCDGAPNFLFCNDGMGKFVESGVPLGVAYDLRGAANGSMGVDGADINGDHVDDLLVTDYSDQLPTLFLSTPELGFDDKARTTRIGVEVLPHANWGVGLVDFDRDGDRDAFLCNGHFLRNVKAIDSRTDFKVANTVMENRNGRFLSVSKQVGNALLQVESSRGAAFDDLDNDGDIDCLILNCDAPAQYLENTSTDRNDWIELELHGRSINRDAVGAKVTVIAGATQQSAEVRSGRGYQSHFGSRLHFGIPKSNTNSNINPIDRIEVRWSKVHKQTFNDPPVNQRLVLVESIGF